ncbi:MAG: DNA replication and repair protein RecF [Bacteroidota bacterium]
MILKHLRLSQFKSHEDFVFDFNRQINCILGENGTGKTNLLDAIYYLSFTKSAFGTLDRNSVSHMKSVFTIFGEYETLKIALQYEKGKSKVLKIDGQVPDKISEVIGKVPLVIMLPDDTSMIREGSDERRKFFDGALSQFDPIYLEALLKYNKLLKQRNSLLKQQHLASYDVRLVATYDDQLIPLAYQISERRAELMKVFIPYLKENYQSLHKGSETPKLVFKTQVKENFAELFKHNFPKDQLMQRTMLGSHRDDFQFLLNDEPIKGFGSQGQQKTFIISLKLALYDFLKEKTGKKPLLLLDDIFDKLDDTRIHLLIKLITDGSRFGQIFVTDARRDRSTQLFEGHQNVNFIYL